MLPQGALEGSSTGLDSVHIKTAGTHTGSMMPAMPAPVWTFRRKLVANALPIAVGLPFLVGAGLTFDPARPTGFPSFGFAVAFPVVTWVALGLLGALGNPRYRQEVARRLDRARPGPKPPLAFVGFARPGYRGLLDPHEDIGFLLFHPDRLEVFGSVLSATIAKKEVVAVRARPNIHTWVGFGRWISIEGPWDGERSRLLLEPREGLTLFDGLAACRRLHRRILAWLAEGDESPPPPSSATALPATGADEPGDPRNA